MTQLQRFELDGNTYYQQARTCSTPGCKCHPGHRHGPYWWERGSDGRVRYLGRELPAELSAARAQRDRLKPAIASDERGLLDQIAKLQRQAQALHRLYHGRPLLSNDEEIIRALGFGDALVSAGASAAAQGERSGW